MEHNIAARAMIVSLRIGQWTARKLDKQATSEVNANHGAAVDAGRYNKLLLPKESLEPITKVVGKARTFMYANTLAWRDNGDRALLSSNWFTYSEAMRGFKQEFDTAVEDFLNGYVSYREQARFRLNSLFKDTDYPSVAEVRSKFYFLNDVMPMPTAGDFRVEIGDDEAERIRSEIEVAVGDMTQKAMESVWGELRDTIEHLVEKLSDPSAKFHATTVSNLVSLADRLPHLNLTDDPKMQQFRTAIKSALAGNDAVAIKASPVLREQVTSDMQKILANMQGIFG